MPQDGFQPKNLSGCSQKALGKDAFRTVLCLFIGILIGIFSPGTVFAASIGSNHLPWQVAQILPGPGSHTPIQPGDVTLLLQNLLNRDAKTRADASRSLSTISPEIKIPALIQTLSDPNWKIQVVAAHHLGQMGSEARSAIPALTAALDSPNPDLRFVMAKALGQIGSEAAVPPLAQALQDKDENVRMAAAIALDSLGPDAQAALAVLQATLRDGNWFVRSHAAKAFVRLAARDKDMLPRLLQAVENPLEESPYFRRKGFQLRRQQEIPAILAIDALAAIGPEVVTPLLGTFQEKKFSSKSDELDYFANITVALMTIGFKAGHDQVINLFATLYNDVPPATGISLKRQDLLRVLGKIGALVIMGKKPVPEKFPPNKVNPALVDALAQKKWQTRVAAVAALMSDSPGASLPYLDKALQDQDWRVRSIAAGAFQNGSRGLLNKALQDEDWRVRLTAVQAANPFGKNTSLLLPLLQDQNETIRLAAALKLTGAARPAQPILIHALQHHRDPRIRNAALEALHPEISPAVQSAVITALQDDSAMVRASAAGALEAAGEQAVPALIKALHDNNEYVRFKAFQALVLNVSPAQMLDIIAALDDVEEYAILRYAGDSPLSESIREKLAMELHHPDWQIRRQAAEKIGVLGFKASVAPSDPQVSSLLRALQDQNPNVRASVAAVLVKNFTSDGDELPPAIAAALKLALPILLAAIKDGDPQARSDAIMVFGELGSAAAPAIPTMRNALLDQNWLVRYSAAIALLKVNSREAAVVPVLAEIFQDPQRCELLEIENKEMHYNELKALGRIASPEATAVLISLLQVSDEKFRYSYYSKDDRPLAAEILLGIGPQVIPALNAALNSAKVRFLAADTLGRMGPPAIPSLLAVLQSAGSDDPALRDIFADKDADRRRAAIYAMSKIGRKPHTNKNAVIKVLTDMMTDQLESVGLRWMAAAALQQMGKNVDSFFADLNLSSPKGDNCIPFDVNDLYGHFDLYAARCLFFQGGRGAGGRQLFEQVHDLFIKTSAFSGKGPQPKPQPAATGR